MVGIHPHLYVQTPGRYQHRCAQCKRKLVDFIHAPKRVRGEAFYEGKRVG